jgi:hypothetical protein
VPAAVAPPLELEVTANQQTWDSQLGRFVATGNAMARIAGGRLLADRIEYETESRTFHAIGAVRFQRGQQYLQASRLRYSLLEGSGDLEDVYGVLDLDGGMQDLDLTAPPSAPLPPAEPISCPPSVPLPPQWHPYPWAVTGWTGQMFAANFGDTFLFRGNLRPEYLGGIGLQRRLLDAGPLAFEIDANLLGHRAASQPGGPFNQAVPYADTPAQSFGDGTLGLGLRLWLQPWLSVSFVEGVSLLTEPSNYERTFRENYANFLNYIAFEVEAKVSPQLSAVGRIHHRSGAYGTYSGVSEGSNAYLLGLRYRYGQSEPVRLRTELPPAQGCPGATPPGGEQPQGLAEQLQVVTLGGGATPAARQPKAPAVTAPNSTAPPQGSVWSRARAQERARQEAIARIDQRVRDVRFQQSLVAERRRGVPNTDNAVNPQTIAQFGGIRPYQFQDLEVSRNARQLVRGTISRWRIQARQLRITPTTLSGDRVGFSNDPFTPAQAWMDSDNVVATLLPNGDTRIKAQRNHLVLEDRLPIPVTRQTLIQKEEEVENRWVLSVDRRDRDGFYAGYDIPVKVGQEGLLTVQPQLMVERAINGSTSSYPLPGQPVGTTGSTQPATTGDLFGLEAKLRTPLAGFDAVAKLDISTFDPANIDAGTRSWGTLDRRVDTPLLGESTLRLFGAYRFRTWNGSLGEEDVYSAYGASLENSAVLPAWGRLGGNYYWRFGLANVKANLFESDNLADYWRGSAVGSLNLALPLWTGKPLPATPTQGLANTAVPVVPGLVLNANVLGSLAYYGNGTNQNTIGITGGPTLTLGRFSKPFLDYTQITITGGGTLRQGLSPLGFDRAVDLATVGIGLTQQIAGPLVFSGAVGYNVDPNSGFFGQVTGSYVELRWQRRAYEIGVYYSPYEGIGGVRVKLNDFNFNGPGLPFVPWQAPQQTPLQGPAEAIRQRPF